MIAYKAILDLGLLSTEPVEVKGVKITPRDFFFKIMPRIPTPEERTKMMASGAFLETERVSVIEIIGEKDGVKTFISYRNLPDPSRKPKARPGGGAGILAAYNALMLLKGEIKGR